MWPTSRPLTASRRSIHLLNRVHQRRTAAAPARAGHCQSIDDQGLIVAKALKTLIPTLGDKQTICSQQKTGGTGVSPVCGSTLPLAMPSAQTGGTPVPPGRCEVQLFPGVGIKPSRCLCVAASPSGIEAARRAGMKTLGIGQAAPARCDWHRKSLAATSPSEIFGFLARMDEVRS